MTIDPRWKNPARFKVSVSLEMWGNRDAEKASVARKAELLFTAEELLQWMEETTLDFHHRADQFVKTGRNKDEAA